MFSLLAFFRDFMQLKPAAALYPNADLIARLRIPQPATPVPFSITLTMATCPNGCGKQLVTRNTTKVNRTKRKNNCFEKEIRL